MPAAHSSATALDFVRFALNEGVLRFGSFKVKSGRISPYFFNAGLFNNGGSVGKLAQFRRLQAAQVFGRRDGIEKRGYGTVTHRLRLRPIRVRFLVSAEPDGLVRPNGPRRPRSRERARACARKAGANVPAPAPAPGDGNG